MKLGYIINFIVVVLIWLGCGDSSNSSKQNDYISKTNNNLNQKNIQDTSVVDELIKRPIKLTIDSNNQTIDLNELFQGLRENYTIDSIQRIYSSYENFELQKLCRVVFTNKMLKLPNSKDNLLLGDEQYLLGRFKADNLSEMQILYFLDVIEDLSSRGVFMLTVGSEGKVIDFEYLFSKGGDGGSSFRTELSVISPWKFRFVKIEEEYTSEDFDSMVVTKTLGAIYIDVKSGRIGREIKEIKKDTVY